MLPSGEKSVEGFSITIEQASRHQAGVYQCMASNGVGQPVLRDITLKVQCKYTEALAFTSSTRPRVPCWSERERERAPGKMENGISPLPRANGKPHTKIYAALVCFWNPIMVGAHCFSVCVLRSKWQVARNAHGRAAFEIHRGPMQRFLPLMDSCKYQGSMGKKMQPRTFPFRR